MNPEPKTPNPTSKILHAGVVQFDVKAGNTEENLNQALAGINTLAEAGAEVVVLPELWSGGFHDNIAADAADTPAILEKLAATAAAGRMVIAGSMAEATDRGIFNTLYVHDSDGTLAGRYRKVHLFTATAEDRSFLAGDQCLVCETSAGSFGLVVCYDVRFPEFCLSLALKGADGLIVCAEWPTSRIHHWEALLRARAIENQLFVVAANRCGRDASIVYGGRSQIVTATGDVAVLAGSNDPAVIHATLDRSAQERFRKAIPSLKERRPDVYGV